MGKRNRKEGKQAARRPSGGRNGLCGDEAAPAGNSERVTWKKKRERKRNKVRASVRLRPRSDDDVKKGSRKHCGSKDKTDKNGRMP